MATKTRSVTQYQIYTLVNVVKSRKNNAHNDVERRELVAIFDDGKKLQAFVKDTDEIKSHDVIEEWVEIKPHANNYSLPFNPKVGEVDFIPAKVSKKK